MAKPPSTGRVRLKDVATAAGVSPITVSRAFSSPHQLHPQTCQHVLEVAHAMGYLARPRQPSEPFVSTRRRVIGVLNPQLDNPFFHELTCLIGRLGETRHMDVLTMDSCNSPEQEKAAIDRLIACGVDGIILTFIASGTREQTACLERLARAGIAVVLLDREIEGPHHGGVYIDNLDCGYQAGCWMRRQPVERLLILSGPPDSRVTIGRVSGIREALAGSAISLEVHYGDFSMAPTERFLNERLGQLPLPDALIGINNQITLGILSAYRQARLPLPEHAGGPRLFCIDGITHAELLGMEISSIRHDLATMATQAMDLIEDALQSGSRRGTRQVVRGHLHLPSDAEQALP
ncbi:LacI family transcriptional regulator [Kushneria pakistanensis]|uniref:LacI family transcriptional regulator n=1 Tax=Kushneria pakistanensis TaxID=1508770 RepID=A0ABQ3FKR6_9GAMM|nr:LacI family DNA-binding transcriptional regulator [Kushneria pakistanensis]GHC27979.1 LacI family transcriptional regulator [Kushneria pakistanensis]